MLPGPGDVGGAAHGNAGGGETLGDVMPPLGEASGRGTLGKAGAGGMPSEGAGSTVPREKAEEAAPPNAGGGSSDGDVGGWGVNRGGARSASGAASIGRCASGAGGNPNDGAGIDG